MWIAAPHLDCGVHLSESVLHEMQDVRWRTYPQFVIGIATPSSPRLRLSRLLFALGSMVPASKGSVETPRHRFRSLGREQDLFLYCSSIGGYLIKRFDLFVIENARSMGFCSTDAEHYFLHFSFYLTGTGVSEDVDNHGSLFYSRDHSGRLSL